MRSTMSFTVPLTPLERLIDRGFRPVPCRLHLLEPFQGTVNHRLDSYDRLLHPLIDPLRILRHDYLRYFVFRWL